MLGITFALPEESRDFLRLLQDKKRGAAGLTEVITGTIGQCPVAVLHTGVGAKICAERIGPFLDAQPLTHVISAGFAGGISGRLTVGELFLAGNFTDPKLLDWARDSLQDSDLRIGALCTLDSVIDNADDRSALARRTGADAADMETETIAAACTICGLPLISLRAISDTAAAPFPAPARVLFDVARQKTSAAVLAGWLLRHPSRVPALISFAGRIAQARRGLTAALRTLVLALDSAV